jgi:quinol monooxygenase YgiN
MWIRVVTITAKAGKEEELRAIGRNRLVAINREAGCFNVYFLEPKDPATRSFGVVSIWDKEETLQAMKESSVYHDLRNALDPLLDSQNDNVYYSHGVNN